MEDGSRGAGDGGNSLRAGALGDGDPGTALQVWDKHYAAGVVPTVVAGIYLSAPLPRPQPGLETAILLGHLFLTGGVIVGGGDDHLPFPQHQDPGLLP